MKLLLPILLFLTSVVSGQSILVYNPTPYPRQQVVVFGIPKGQAPKGSEILYKLPTVDVCTARVRVPAHHNGYVSVAQGAAAPSPGLGFDFSANLPMSINGTAPFKELTPIAANTQMLVRHLVARTKTGLIGHLIVYQGFGEDWCRYEFVIAAEFLDAAEKVVTAELVLGGQNTKVDRLMPTEQTGKLRDRQGFGSYGAIIAPAHSDETLMEMSTKAGLRIWELTVCGKFERWGPWGVPPAGRHLDRNIRLGLLDHRGIILDKHPGKTGEQFGFGVTKHLDCQRPGQIHRLAHDRAAVLQEACRPIWLFEPDGTLPIISKHPQFISWDETWHWHPNIGRDRFGRTYSHGGWYEGWIGMDRQHYSAVALSEDVLLRGGFLSQLILKMKVFHFLTEIGYPTSGRALGRYMFAARDLYLATGDERIIAEIRKRWLPEFKKNWTAVNGHWVRLTDLLETRPFVLRLIADDPHTKIPGNEWVVWEDGIAVQGLDVLGRLLNDPEITLAAFLLGRSVVQHGFSPNGRILKAIKWTAPLAPLGPELADSAQTNYTEWALPGLGVTFLHAVNLRDQGLQKSLLLLLLPLMRSEYGNLDSYRGLLGTRGS